LYIVQFKLERKMKKIVLTILTAAAALGFSEEPVIAPTPLPDLKPVLQEKELPKQGFFYVRFSTAERDLAHVGPILPGLGIGYRRLAGDGAADISINGIGRAERKNGQIFWTAPKASYMRYLQPNSEKSFYAGGGLSWGGISSKSHNFIGLIPSATIGYEFLHRTAFLGFAEFNISQPAIAVYHDGIFPGPIAELSMGVGF